MKNKILKGEISLNKKKYKYSLEKKTNGNIFVECKAAKVSQEFLSEDVVDLLVDLPELIISEKDYSKKASEVIQFRVTPKDKIRIEKKAQKEGFDSISSYLRDSLLST
jgi:hypothetical protein